MFIDMNPKKVVLIAFGVLMVIGLCFFKDYGVPWDETNQDRIGVLTSDYVLKNDLSLFKAPSTQYHGPVIPTLFLFLERLLNLEDSRSIILMKHFANFVFFYIGVIFFYLLLNLKFNSWKVSLSGCMFLVLSPRIFAESFYNYKDIPSMVMSILCLYSLLLFLKRKNIYRIFLHAFFCAVLIDIRITGIILPFLTILILVLDSIKDRASKEKLENNFKSSLIYIFLTMFFLVLFWPALWENPILSFINAYRWNSKVGSPNFVVWYFGEYIKAAEIQWHYIPVWIIITTPILYTVTFLICLGVTIVDLVKKPLVFYENNREDLIFILSFFIPIVSVISFNAVVYDGWRHLYFVYPSFLLISIKGLVWLIDLFKKRRKYFFLCISLTLLPGLLFMIVNHPYQNVYFNRLAGKDMGEVAKRFEMDYWGLSYRKGLEFILKHDTDREIKILVENKPGYLNALILPKEEKARLRFIQLDVDKYDPEVHKAKYFITTYRFRQTWDSSYPELYSVKVGGEKIMTVFLL